MLHNMALAISKTDFWQKDIMFKLCLCVKAQVAYGNA